MLRFKDLIERINETRSLYLEEVEQVDEISANMANRYLAGKRKRDYDTSADGFSRTSKMGHPVRGMNRDMKGTMRALRTIEKSKKTNEEAEGLDEGEGRMKEIAMDMETLSHDDFKRKHRRSKQDMQNSMKSEGVALDELSMNTLASYTKKASADFSDRKPKMGYDGQLKKMQNRRVGVNRALDKMYGEEAEQTDEALTGNQHKIDANKNGKVDGHDFKILRNAKKARYQ